MVSQVGSISMPNYGVNPLSSLNPLQANTTANTDSLLNFGSNTANPLLPNGNNYEDDLLMPAELKINNQTTASVPLQNSTVPTSQTAQTPVLSQNSMETDVENMQQPNMQNKQEDIANQLKGTLAKPSGKDELTENGNPYKKTSFWTKAGATLGFLAPLSGKIAKVFKGGKIAKLFSLKQLVTVCPMIAIAGYGVGSLIDGCINSNRAKKADEDARLALQSQQSQQTQPINMVA